jgi:metal-responsive CopG/Arc/MetJ family transcriptional regulator
MASQRISVRVPREVVQRVKERSRATGARPSEVVREALEKYLDQEQTQTAYDLARKAGLIGYIRGGRKDVSTNKSLFKGFGKSK